MCMYCCFLYIREARWIIIIIIIYVYPLYIQKMYTDEYEKKTEKYKNYTLELFSP